MDDSRSLLPSSLPNSGPATHFEDRRDTLFIKLLFSARRLADAHILRYSLTRVRCDECQAPGVSADDILHQRHCHVGVVLSLLAQLAAHYESGVEQEEQAAIEKEEAKIRTEIFFEILAKLDAARAVHMVADENRHAPEVRKQLLERFPNLDGATLEAFVIFQDQFYGTLRCNSYYMMQTGGVASDRKQLWALAKQVGINADAVTAKHFHDIYADASSFASLSKTVKLYPKDVKWPGEAKPAKKAAAPAAKKSILSPEAKKRIAAAQKKRWAEAKKKGARK
jgi:hypothetical protein